MFLRLQRLRCARKCVRKYAVIIGIMLAASAMYAVMNTRQQLARLISLTLNHTDDDGTSRNLNVPISKCEVVYLAVCVRSVDDARQAAAMLKTVFHSRTVPLDLHVIVGSEQIFRTTSTLLNTWELSRVNFTIHKVSEELVDKRKWPLVKFQLDKVLPVNVERVLYISNRVRLLDDVGALCRHIFNDNDDNASLKSLFTVASVVVRACGDKDDKECQYPHDLMGVNLIGLREQSLRFTQSINSSQDHLDALLATFRDRTSTTIDCSWTVRLESTANLTDRCLPIKGVVGIVDLSVSDHEQLEQVKETLTNIAKSEFIDNFRHKSSVYPVRDARVEIAAMSGKECSGFRRIARLKRRTHLNFFAGLGDEGDSNIAKVIQTAISGNGVDVTLATQLTIDRFPAFERMLSAWDGPASVAFYVKDDEVDQLTSMIVKSKSLSVRRNVIYHVVYKRMEPFYAINYLRNVAVNNTHTTHVFYNDIDLIPNVGIHQQLKTWIERLRRVHGDNTSDNMALVVPSFNADKMIDALPNKTELLKLMKEGGAEAYGMSNGWNLGHKPTNYTHWPVSNEPYCVTYHDAFEPYVVVRMDSSPRFNELMLERFADKAMYVRTLHAVGFKLCVLPDVFVIHLPHKDSNIWSLVYDKYTGYRWCASVISDEYKNELSRRYPKVVF